MAPMHSLFILDIVKLPCNVDLVAIAIVATRRDRNESIPSLSRAIWPRVQCCALLLAVHGCRTDAWSRRSFLPGHVGPVK